MLRWGVVAFLFCGLPMPGQESTAGQVPIFGVTVVIPTGFQGDIYFLRRHNGNLGNIEKKRAKGTIYTTRLDVPPQDFKQGFPGVTDRLEWFAIDYHSKFYVSVAGTYRFRLLSDDGSELYLDGRKVIDNGGLHPPQAKEGSFCLPVGVHEIRVVYFQGTKYLVALVLEVAPPGEKWHVFDTNHFAPPPGEPSLWPKPAGNPCGPG